MHKLLLLSGSLILGTSVIGQMQTKQYNYTDFTQIDQEITEEMYQLIPKAFHDHPEFGKIAYNAPCDNCFELIHERTDSTKLYVERNSNGTHFYSQAIYGIFHYEKDGNQLTYDPRLSHKGNNIYRSDNQDTPTQLDINGKSSSFFIGNKEFKFNNELTLILVNNNASETNLGVANWSNYTVGDEGIHITNAWEGIDITISYELDRVKTNYVINNELNYLEHVKYLKFSDNLVLPVGYSMVEGDKELFDSSGNRYGEYFIRDEINVKRFEIEKAFGYDQSGVKERSSSFYYEYGEDLSLFVPANWIRSDEAVFPLIIDPLVTSTATQTGGWMSFQHNGAFCSSTGSCNYNLSVPRPNNSTITGTTFSAFYQSLGGYCGLSCWLNEAGYKITSPCGVSPAPSTSFWSCNSNSPGTCTATNYDVFPELGSCLGSACNGNVTFQIQNSYCYCSTGGNCGDNCQWMPNNTWSVTLEGRTLETLGNQSTGNGNLNITPVSCSGTNVTLNPTPANGVPGYTYSWSTGSTSPTITISPYSYTGQTVSASVTDACGVTRTAQFQIQCPLAVSLTEFNVENLGESVLLEWITETETDNDYFEVYRSEDGKEFEVLDKVQGAGNSTETINYNYKDIRPFLGISYYKLGIVDMDGNTEFTDIKTVQRNNDNQNIQLIPNPAKENVAIAFEFPTTAEYEVKIIDALGKERFLSKKEFKKGMQTINVNTENYSQGVYMVMIVTKNNVNSAKLVIQ
ncbi:MAG TPA: T9SS type A sorting domain-containing protein [Brumimicrobium sp.]|nr:T9SS type A sorting domain-containing protein [Brumimicrobium sp.]